MGSNKNPKRYAYKGQMLTARELAALPECEQSRDQLNKRLRKYPAEEAIKWRGKGKPIKKSERAKPKPRKQKNYYKKKAKLKPIKPKAEIILDREEVKPINEKIKKIMAKPVNLVKDAYMAKGLGRMNVLLKAYGW